MPVWTQTLAIGIAEIDRQHRALFERAAKFEAAVKARKPAYHLEELFSYLEHHMQTHFEAEERFMRERGYPHLAEHLKEHLEFKRTLHSLLPHWESEGESPALVMALVGLLDQWLTEHVSTSDRDFGEFMSKPGVG
jgi:hemerythrin